MLRPGLFLLLASFCSAAVRVQTSTEDLREVEHEFAIDRSSAVPVFHMEKFRGRPAQMVTRREPSITFENDHYRVKFLPRLGLIWSFALKPGYHEQLWQNPAAKPIGAHNDTKFWVTRGGIEHVLPRGEHGTTHAATWTWKLQQSGPKQAALRMETTEPLTGLRLALLCTVRDGSRALEIDVSVRNPGTETVRFSHWTNHMVAPGGTGELTPRTEFIVPAERFLPADKPFNKWMEPLLGPTGESPLRFVENWKSIGDLITTPLREPWTAVLSHEKQQALILRTDLTKIRTVNFWTWGYPPSEKRQTEYTAAPPNLGYAEVWFGTVKDYSDETLQPIGPGETQTWRESICGLQNVQDRAVLLRRLRECR